MRDVPAGRECPGCGETHVVKNGCRGGRQQYRCGSSRCGLQFSDRPEAFGQRFSAGVIASSIELYLEGMPYKKIAAEVGRRFSVSDTEISGSTVLRWVEEYLNIAVQEVRKLRVETHGPWRVSYASLYPAEGGCWVVRDLATSYVLAAQADASFDPAAATEVIKRIGASTGNLSDNFHLFTFGTDEDFGNPEGLPDVLEAIEGQFSFADHIPPKYILTVHRPDGIFSPSGTFRLPLQIMRKRRVFRSPESRQRFLDGWAVMLNFFVKRADPGGPTPAQTAGVRAPFRSWLDVVNHRVKVPEERPVRKKGGRVDRRRWGDSG